jgi:hypothetical protein
MKKSMAKNIPMIYNKRARNETQKHPHAAEV